MKRGTIIGIVAGGLVVVLLWYFFLYSPTSSDLNDTKSQVSAAEQQKQELENSIRQLKELSRNAPQQEADLRALRAAVPENPDLGEFVLQANEIATASGVDFLSISPSPPVANTSSGPKSTIALSIQIDGGFFQLLDYLARLEHLDRLVILDSVSVSTGDTGTSGSTGSTGSTAGSGSTSGSSSTDPTLSVTLTGRMFTNAEAAPVAGSTGGTTSGGTTTPTPTTPTTSSSSSSSGNS